MHISTINLFLRILATETPCSQLIRDMGTDVIPLKRNWSKLSLLLFIANTYINLKSLATLSMDVASSAFLSLVVVLFSWISCYFFSNNIITILTDCLAALLLSCWWKCEGLWCVCTGWYWRGPSITLRPTQACPAWVSTSRWALAPDFLSW